MENITKLIFIRHGESLGNAERLVCGHLNVDLTEIGYKQAKKAAEYLKNEKIDVIYSSDLIRAYNTAFPHAQIRGLDVIKSKNLREVDVGAWENRYVDEIIAEWGREEYYNAWIGGFGTYKFPSGESIPDACERFYNEIMDICSKNVGKTILIVSHGAIIRAFWSKIRGVKPENIANEVPTPANASISIAYYENEKIIADIYSDSEYLVKNEFFTPVTIV